MYVMNQPTKWEDYLHSVESAYNNRYQTSLRKSVFEVLYGRKCRVPINWSSLENILVLRTNLLKDMD